MICTSIVAMSSYKFKYDRMLVVDIEKQLKQSTKKKNLKSTLRKPSLYFLV